MQRIKQGDEVIVRTGKDKGKSGRVSKVLKDNKVLVEGINQVKKNQKPNPNAGVSGGIIVKDMPINISNIGLYNPETKKADRVGFKFLEDGKKVRYFKSTNEVVDV
ncbi:MAG: 50S ribosomal protein L24 [Methylobacter sp.]|jgi:large subunit ribosomal protein L24|uniref:Large ribosomal subunit protein uL24 n=2 Tax=Methylobacter tundripaludum TaxID=173365 RepID=G3ITA8_METTV|nr:MULTISPECIES: 50S ribosomal protein L24 [Methylobacter]EGW22507.1 ribosomal protein L24 [Methylobacter tundripaludum SV96]MDD4905048.1 50S ribosomal protein L24 [Methylobacter tundripaludum]MDI1278976.1 50S ribosomal protein L24 [Methylobacter sp.]MDI1359766.1 50S ribosomal protein L24 [Methylobacter sp.]MDO9049047.1 50S ribosomal protein L24 [Methylobacter sp.]